MKRGGAILISGMVSFLALSPESRANVPEGSGDPYRGIVDRNVFGLKPPPAPPRPEDVKPPAPDIMLTGITTILGNKRALLKVPAKPPLRPKDEFYILTEGQSEAEIEVLNIDEVAGTVKVRNHGAVQTLDFVSNGVKVAGGSPPGAPPPAPMGMNLPAPVPGAMRQIPPRQMRTAFSGGTEQTAPAPPNLGSAVPGQTSAGFMTAQAMPQTGTGTGTGLTFNGSGPGFTSTPDYGINKDEQDVLIEANRAKLIEEGRADEASMLPPTDLSPPEGQPLMPQ